MHSWTIRRVIPRVTAAVVVTISLVVTGCAPVLQETPDHPERPRLLDFRLDRSGVASGCPVHVTVRFEDPDADIVQAVIGWQHKRGSRTVDRGVIPLPVETAQVRDRRSGEMEAPLTLVPHGSYWLTAQLIDVRGGHSNTLDRLVNVFAQPSPPRCEDTHRRRN
jgi:hypothetical protein